MGLLMVREGAGGPRYSSATTPAPCADRPPGADLPGLAEALEVLFGRTVGAYPSGPPRRALPGVVTVCRRSASGQGWLVVSELGLAVSLVAALTSGPPTGSASRARTARERRAVRTAAHLAEDLQRVFVAFSAGHSGMASGWAVQSVAVVARLGDDDLVAAASPQDWWTYGSICIEGFPAGRLATMAVS